MQLPNVEILTNEDKIWFARSIAGMIVADGHVDDSEMDSLKEAISFLEDREEVDRLMAIVKSGKPPQLQVAQIESKQAFIILKYLAELMVADSVLSPSEVDYFIHVGKMLGFPPAILTKLWQTARQSLEATLPQGLIDTGKGGKLEVALLSLSEASCSFRFPRPLTPNSRLILEVRKGENEYYSPVQMRLDRQTSDKHDPGSYRITAKIEQRLGEGNGVLEALYPDRYMPAEDTRLTPNKSSLSGSLVRCHICQTPKIPFYILRSRSMITKSNLFGIPSYVKPAGQLDFCDFSLLEVKSCPDCGFSSNHIEDFQKTPRDVAEFDVAAFKEGWEEAIAPQLKKMQADQEGYMSEERSPELAILSYDMALTTLKHLLSKLTDDRDKLVYSRKMASLMMIQAELMMNNGKREQAIEQLKKVVGTLEPLFELMEGEVIMRAATLMFQIMVYLKDFQKAGQYMKFMDNYDTEGKLDPNGSEYKTLQICAATIKKTYDDREMLAFDKLKDFHLEE